MKNFTLGHIQEVKLEEHAEAEQMPFHQSKTVFSPNKRRKQAYTDNFSFSQQEDYKMRPAESIIKQFGHQLIPYEKQEILKFNDIYYIGTKEAKDARKFKSILGNAKDTNNGFDRNGGLYKVIPKDHLFYRYEIIQELDRGAFG